VTPAYTLPLYNFLLAAFSRDELGRVIRWNFADLHPQWPEGKSQAACAEWVVASVTIDRVPGLLDLLTGERPRRKVEIDAIRALLVVPAPTAPTQADLPRGWYEGAKDSGGKQRAHAGIYELVVMPNPLGSGWLWEVRDWTGGMRTFIPYTHPVADAVEARKGAIAALRKDLDETVARLNLIGDAS
jgi:hypothetical protein